MAPRSTSLLPPRCLAVPMFVKPALFWLFVRASMAALGMWVTPPLVSFGVLTVVLIMVLADTKLLRERPFLDNLGVGRLRTAIFVVLTLEATVGAVGRVLGS